MKYSLSLLAVSCLIQSAVAQNLQWAYVMGIPSPASRALAVTTDAAGFVYIGGTFRGQLDFNPGSDSDKISSAGYGNAFIMKMDAAGNYVKTVPFGTSSNCFSATSALQFDASGNLHVAGYFTGNNLDFDPDTSVFKMSELNGGNNAFLMKMDASGKFLWARRWDYNKDAGGGSGTLEEGPCMSLDGSGNVYCAGHFVGKSDFDPDTSKFEMSATQSDGYILKFNTGGKLLWAKQVRADTAVSKFVTVKSLSSDAAGNVYLAGEFIGITDFDPDTTTTHLVTATTQMGFILKLDPSGNFLWVKKIGKENANVLFNYNTATAVLPDGSGNVYLTGSFMETVDFGSTQLTSEGLSDIFIAKLDGDGNYLWAKSAGSFYDGEYGYRLTLDDAGNVVVSGAFHGTINFSGHQLTTHGNTDIFILKLTPQGSPLWVRGFGGSSYYERIQSMAVDGNNIYSVGRLVGSVNFDPNGSYVLTTASSNAYYPNFFMQKLVEYPTGLSDPDNNIAGIYPNPATDRVTIELKNSIGTATISLYDLQGKMIRKQLAHSAITTLSVADLPKGVYLLKIQGRDGYAVKKLAVQ